MHLNVNRFFKYLTVIVLFIGLGFHSESSQFQCIELFRNETGAKANLSLPQVPAGFSDIAKEHILKGEYNKEGKLDGGLHSVDGFFKLYELNSFLEIDYPQEKWDEFNDLLAIAKSIYPRNRTLGYHYAQVRILDNGVILVELPPSVLTRKAQNSTLASSLKLSGGANLKSLFPIGWSHDFIINTVKQIAAKATDEERFIRRAVKRTFRGINIIVRFDENGQIGSAYPALDQPKMNVEINKFSAHQKLVIETFFCEPLAQKIAEGVQGFVHDIVKKSNVDFENQNWFNLISVELREEIFEKYKSYWLLDDPLAVSQGLQQGFSNSILVKENLEKNLGVITFTNRLFAERKSTPANQARQKARLLLTHFGITAPTAFDVENVYQVLIGFTTTISTELHNKLNAAARKSLALHFRPARGSLSEADTFEYDAQYHWNSIFFTDVSADAPQ